jgi:peptide deformylase
MLQIVQAPSPVLSGQTKKINKVDNSIRKFIEEMAYTLENTTDPEGVGLAATQVGESLQLFVIKESPKSPLLVFINPEIISKSKKQYPIVDSQSKKKKGVKLEGCLSLKDIWGIVHRSNSVKLSYTDEKGNRHTEIFNGFLATIIQHECDHLQGILFPKRVLEQNEKLYKATTDDKGELVFEEMAI